MGKFNKASVTVLIGALVQVGIEFYPMTASKWSAIGTLLAAVAVFFVPNTEPKA